MERVSTIRRQNGQNGLMENSPSFTFFKNFSLFPNKHPPNERVPYFPKSESVNINSAIVKRKKTLPLSKKFLRVKLAILLRFERTWKIKN